MAVVGARAGCDSPNETRRRRPPVRRRQAAVFAPAMVLDERDDERAPVDELAVELGLELVALMDWPG